MAYTVVVVEDDAAVSDMVVDSLDRAGFRALAALSAAHLEELLKSNHVDVFLLDWMLPGTSGIHLAQRLRRSEKLRDTPIIMMTAKGEEADRLSGFEAGVDDYVVKPFSVRELIARIEAVLRRYKPTADDAILVAGPLELDPVSHRVSAGPSASISLGPTEFRLLKHLMSHPNRVFSRTQLLDAAWGQGVVVEERTVDVHVRRLRKALSPSGCDRFVQTVHGSGYRFSERD